MNATSSNTNLLNLGTTQTNAWSEREYKRLKKNQSIKYSFRNSKVVSEIIQNLRVQTPHCGPQTIQSCRCNHDCEEPNFPFQFYYGRAYSEMLQQKHTKPNNLLRMRNLENCIDLLDVRNRMVDWMLEVFTVYCKQGKGSNEITYFKAVDILDRGINSKLINGGNIHIYGIASMFLASASFDSCPITLQDAYEELGHGTFTPMKIQQHIHLLTKEIGFKLTNPTLVEYLDKIVFDIFGDYRTSFATFNIRQSALFLLQCTLYDVQFQTHRPKVLCTVALLHSIEVFFTEYENKKDLSLNECLSLASNKENLYCAIIAEAQVERSQLNTLLNDLNQFLKVIKKQIECGEFKQLEKHYSLNFKTLASENPDN